MKTRLLTLLVLIAATTGVFAKEYYGIIFGMNEEVNSENAADIFGDGKASYVYSTNTLILEQGFSYSLSKGFVSFQTEREFHILLRGDAEIKASIHSYDDIKIEAAVPSTLTITANISGSGIECPNLTVTQDAELYVLSRNSAQDMYAIQCENTLTVISTRLEAKMVNSSMAIALKKLDLKGVTITTPAGGVVNNTKGGICYADGTSARWVIIDPSEYTAVDDLSATPIHGPRKILSDGQVLILMPDGRTLNLLGAELN